MNSKVWNDLPFLAREGLQIVAEMCPEYMTAEGAALVASAAWKDPIREAVVLGVEREADRAMRLKCERQEQERREQEMLQDRARLEREQAARQSDLAQRQRISARRSLEQALQEDRERRRAAATGEAA